MASSFASLPLLGMASFCMSLLLPHCMAEVSLWPLPRTIKWGDGLPIPLSASFEINVPQKYELLHAAKRYKTFILKEKWVSLFYSLLSQQPVYKDMASSPLQVLDVVVNDLEADLQQDVDESYTIFIPAEGKSGTLWAPTIWGALHGLETFSQLVQYQRNSYGESDCGIHFLEHGVHIEDGPLYPYRGVLLDTARNFYPVKDILRTIRALSYNKLNVLHWHITDSHSFPIEILTEPELARKGSYGSIYTYSQSDIKKIIQYARLRGVRVIPEIDIPGHTASWGAAYPDIVTCTDQIWWRSSELWTERMAAEPAPGQLNPLNAETYKVVKNVIEDVASLFPDNFYHSGGDEVTPNCWKSHQNIIDYLASSEEGTLSSLLEKFISTTYPYVISKGKTLIYWEDLLLDNRVNVSESSLSRETTVLETWNNGPLNTKRLTSAGFRTIVASADFYYLDCGHGSFLGNDTRVDTPLNPDPSLPNFNYGGNGGSWCAPYKTWQRVYDYDIAYNLTQEEANLVLGGEVSLWSEQADATTLDALLWPRASALAEALWLGNKDTNGMKRSAEAINRLNDWRYRMVERGIGAAALQPLWCLKNKDQCNLVE